MCYICRKDIGFERYTHFCQHFRIIPGTKCKYCDNCDLYQKEADDIIVRNAAVKAEKDWRRNNSFKKIY